MEKKSLDLLFCFLKGNNILQSYLSNCRISKQVADGMLSISNTEVQGKPGQYRLILRPHNVNAEA